MKICPSTALKTNNLDKPRTAISIFDKRDWPIPKKIDFIFTTKITKEKKNKKYNLRALRVLRGVITLFLP